MNFRSDNTAPAAPEILAALTRCERKRRAAVRRGRWSKQLDEKFGELFEREVRVFTVATGTAANSISLASADAALGRGISVIAKRTSSATNAARRNSIPAARSWCWWMARRRRSRRTALKEALARNARDIHSVVPSARLDLAGD